MYVLCGTVGQVKKGLPSEKKGLKFFLTFLWDCGTGRKRFASEKRGLKIFLTFLWDCGTGEKRFAF